MKINEVEKLLGMSSYTIRYYEKMGFVTPQRDESGYRSYYDTDLLNLKRVRFLRELDIPLEDIHHILSDPDKFQNILKDHVDNLDKKIESLEEIQNTCKELNEQDIPLLDEIIDCEIKNTVRADQGKINTIKEILKPIKTTVIGGRCDRRNYFKGVLLVFVIVLIPILIIMGKFKNDLNLSNVLLFIIAIFLSLIIAFIVVSLSTSNQR